MIFFRQKLEEVITLPPPPKDDMKEALQVRDIVNVRTPEQVQSVRDHDQDPYFAIKKVIKKYKLAFHPNELEQILKESVPIITHFKNFYNRKTGELSSGQKNRVSLAKSLINKPEILLLDEPTASLDPDIGDFIRSYIQEYKKNNSVTVLLASHNMSEVERLCDSIIMMKKGKIIDSGSCQDLIKKHGRDNLEETFLKLARSKNEF